VINQTLKGWYGSTFLVILLISRQVRLRRIFDGFGAFSGDGGGDYRAEKRKQLGRILNQQKTRHPECKKKLAQRALCFVLIVHISVNSNIFLLNAIMFYFIDVNCYCYVIMYVA